MKKSGTVKIHFLRQAADWGFDGFGVRVLTLFTAAMFGMTFASFAMAGGGAVRAAQELTSSSLRLDSRELAVVETASGSHTFKVEVADDERSRMIGLMYRRNLAPDRGMLFLWDDVEPRSFWMRNTYISLDIFFLDTDGRIIHIAENTEPLSDNMIPSRGPIIAVLEVNAGTAAEKGIQVGDVVRHPFFEDRLSN